MNPAVQKSPEAFRTISEVAVELEVPQHVLRFWEGRFTQVKPLKRGGGRRYYRPEDVDLLRGIASLLYRDGLTIKGVQKILREHGVRYVAEMGRGSLSLLQSPRATAALAAAPQAYPSEHYPNVHPLITEMKFEPKFAADSEIEPEIEPEFEGASDFAPELAALAAETAAAEIAVIESVEAEPLNGFTAAERAHLSARLDELMAWKEQLEKSRTVIETRTRAAR